MDKLSIGEKVVIPYPSEEIAELREVIKNSGVLTDIQKKFNMAKNTITRIAELGKGRKENVEAIRDYVKLYKEVSE